ncbi:alpha/beta fold hydrolase [Amphibacillus sp. MSJ-3]|uniref:alpha/beta fold hydrolase n=1 Tax=Amphibacillus sp. MSJ-3 TaxID=2841505 RepID=UPI001C0E9A3A|nr:alpha/beta fold hydrolase [Amphibacillus sp. MSJ-3]MBU5595226.1 alpha/beta fold hydrolase [Amphibacillus sp. MSJ-3]
MIQIERVNWDGIPVLICTKKTLYDSALPIVIYLHGITGAKEDNLSIGYLLAERGFRVILPDAYMHGERDNQNTTDLELHFFEIVENNLTDLKVIYDQLVNLKLIKNQSITLAGTSMGGISTAAALTCHPWISRAAIMMGTAKLHAFSEAMIKKKEMRGIELPISKQEQEVLLDRLKQYDLSLNTNKLENRPLFIWHGDEDRVVPYDHAKTFYDQLIERPSTKDVTFLKEKGIGHKVTRQARLALVDWIAQSTK